MTELIIESTYKLSDKATLHYSHSGSDYPFTIKTREIYLNLTPREAQNLVTALRHHFRLDITFRFPTSSEKEPS